MNMSHADTIFAVGHEYTISKQGVDRIGMAKHNKRRMCEAARYQPENRLTRQGSSRKTEKIRKK
jgi:hypothetical protein